MKKKLTDEQASEVVDRYLRGETTVSISADFGLTPGSVCNYVLRAGFPLRSMGPDEALVKINKLLDEGLTHLEVREALHVSTTRMKHAVAARRTREEAVSSRVNAMLDAGRSFAEARRETGASVQMMASAAKNRRGFAAAWLVEERPRRPGRPRRPERAKVISERGGQISIGQNAMENAQLCFKRQWIISALAENGFSPTKTAASIGVSKQSIHSLMEKLGVPPTRSDGFRAMAMTIAMEMETSAKRIRERLT